MGWVRRNTRLGSWLALAALALQMAVAFGHVHLDDLRFRSAVAVAGPAAPGTQPRPAQQPGNNDANDYCAICATIFLAANSFLPQAPQLSLPFASRQIEHADRVAAVFVAARRVPFQSRAPPLG